MQKTYFTQETPATTAFTMAEILLSLTIIGVVAAITLPSLMANINEKTWNTQRKALYARMSQAVAMMPQVGGYGILTEDADGNVTTDTAAETFLSEGLSKVLKINNICDNEHLADCGISKSYTNLVGSTKSTPTNMWELNSMFNSTWTNGTDSVTYSQTNTKAAAFETQNGESLILYYNPNCKPIIQEKGLYQVQHLLCANFVFDLNGQKGPNHIGKDMGFISVLYPTEPVIVNPNISSQKLPNQYGQKEANTACTQADTESRLPNTEELMSIFYNKILTNNLNGEYWSNQAASIDNGWIMSMHSGTILKRAKTRPVEVMCIKR